MNAATMKITRIIRIEDTRQYEEGPDDRWYPIPGSGVENQCARCGRMHEVHALVELEDNTSAVVGTGCARGDDLIKCAQFASAANAAKRLRGLRAKLAKAEANAAIYSEALRVVDALTPPAAVWTKAPNKCSAGDHHVIAVGEGKAYSYQPGELSPSDRREREDCARNGWRAARMTEALPAGFKGAACGYSFKYEAERLKQDIAKVEKRLAALMAPAVAV
jgi:hypothetical protein